MCLYITHLVAPYRAIPRDSLSQRYPPIARYGVFGVSTWPIWCDTPSPFSERFPLGEQAKWRCDTPPPTQKGYLSDTCAIPHENKANGCDTPLCDTISKGYCAIWGGISHWAPKITHANTIANRSPCYEFSETTASQKQQMNNTADRNKTSETRRKPAIRRNTHKEG